MHYVYIALHATMHNAYMFVITVLVFTVCTLIYTYDLCFSVYRKDIQSKSFIAQWKLFLCI